MHLKLSWRGLESEWWELMNIFPQPDERSWFPVKANVWNGGVLLKLYWITGKLVRKIKWCSPPPLKQRHRLSDTMGGRPSSFRTEMVHTSFFLSVHCTGEAPMSVTSSWGTASPNQWNKTHKENSDQASGPISIRWQQIRNYCRNCNC